MPPTGPPQHPGWTARRVRASGLSVVLALLVIIGVLVARSVFVAASQPIGWVAAAAAVALVITPLVELLDRYVPRAVAIIATLALGITLVVTVGVSLVMETQEQLAELAETLPAAAADIEEDRGPDSVVAEIGLASLVEDLVDQVSGRVAPPPVDDAVGTLPSFFVSGVLVVFFLVWGPALLAGAERQITDPDRRQRVTDIARTAASHTQGYIVGTVALALLTGLAAGLVAWWADLPTPLVLGALIGGSSVVPYVGVLFGGTPMLLLSAAIAPGTTTALLVVALIALQIGATLGLRLVIEATATRVGPAIIVIALLLGSDAYGIGGALVALVAAVLLASVIDVAGDDEDLTAEPVRPAG